MPVICLLLSIVCADRCMALERDVDSANLIINAAGPCATNLGFCNVNGFVVSLFDSVAFGKFSETPSDEPIFYFVESAPGTMLGFYLQPDIVNPNPNRDVVLKT